MSDGRSRLDFPAAREAPPRLVVRLRAVDPTAELLYWGRGRWLLGTVRRDRRAVATAGKKLVAAQRALARHIVQSKTGGRVRLDQRSVDQANLAVLALQGFRPFGDFYRMTDPDGRIVEDFRRADWLYRTTTDEAFIEALEAPRLAARHEARNELTDYGRAADAWRYAFTRSHLVSRTDPQAEPYHSGRTVVPMGESA